MANVQMTFTAPGELVLTRAFFRSNVPLENKETIQSYNCVLQLNRYNNLSLPLHDNAVHDIVDISLLYISITS